jgi:HEAT repeat protein
MPPLAARLRQLTYVLLDTAQVGAAARALREIDHPDAVDALCERLADPAPVAGSVALVRALARRPERRAREALRSALRRAEPPVAVPR